MKELLVLVVVLYYRSVYVGVEDQVLGFALWVSVSLVRDALTLLLFSFGATFLYISHSFARCLWVRSLDLHFTYP